MYQHCRFLKSPNYVHGHGILWEATDRYQATIAPATTLLPDFHNQFRGIYTGLPSECWNARLNVPTNSNYSSVVFLLEFSFVALPSETTCVRVSNDRIARRYSNILD
ncbi:hypothetical protein J6590_022341 [Homalodisca vitripennis]|nr:hypothetical protein J6590_022341 [Homalodisca vitripennis]